MTRINSAMSELPILFTVGHSIRTLDEFVSLLKNSNQVACCAVNICQSPAIVGLCWSTYRTNGATSLSRI